MMTRSTIDGHPGLIGPVDRPLGPPGLERSMPREIFGDDDRQRIGDTSGYPWRAVCALRITAGNGATLLGSGWLAGRLLVITAGHCVFDHDRGGWVQSIEVSPGRNGGSRPFGPFVSTTFRSVEAWSERGDPEHDYGAIFLPAPAAGEPAPGDAVGWFGWGSASASELQDGEVNLAGYPKDKPEGTLWWHSRRIDQVRTSSLGYTIDTKGGQSGSPVWRLANEVRQVVGIHAGMLHGANQAVRINADVMGHITSWSGQAG